MSSNPVNSSILVLTVLLAAGCEPESAGPTEAVPALRSESAPPTQAEQERARVAITAMLRAHHADDLPTRTAIEAHRGGPAALRWVAEHHPLQGVRARGLLALSLFPDDASLAVLHGVLADPGASASLRAASTRALSGWNLSERADLRALAVESLQSDELSVAVAGAVVLHDVPEARAALDARDTASTPSALRRQLR